MLHRPCFRVSVLWRGVIPLVLVTLATSVAVGGPIFLPGRMQGNDFVADKTVAREYSIKFSDHDATIEHGRCTLRVRETIVGPEKGTTTVCLIPVPKSVHQQRISLSIRREGSQSSPKAFRWLSAEEAQAMYESIARQTGDVKFVSLSGTPVLLIPNVVLQGQLELDLSFSMPVSESHGVSSVVFPMPSAEWSTTPLGRVILKTTLNSDDPLRAIFSPSHDVSVKRNGLHEATVRAKTDNSTGGEDFRLCWVADKEDLGLRILPYRENSKDGGYFLLVGNPTGNAEGDKSIVKDMIFVLDTSGSMRGEKIEQCRAAIEYCLTRLNPGDRFNIVTFGTDVTGFRESPVTRSPKTMSAAQTFVENIVARGRTNIGGALAKSLAGRPHPGRPRIVIFLTDGTPTVGEQDADKILSRIADWNTSDSRVFVMGVGDDVNAHLLDNLAEATSGSSQYIPPEEEIDAKVAVLYDRLSHPVLTSVRVDFGELATDSVFPRTLPALFKGSEFMIFGRYRGGGLHTITVRGSLNGVETKYTCRAQFPKTAQDNRNEFVAPLWASRNVGFLLQELRLHGEKEELLKEVIRLSKKFGIVTEYTEFLGSTVGGTVSASLVLEEARQRVTHANQFKAGRWAVQQARNDRELQTKRVVGNAANVYFDRRGQKVGRANVYQLGARCFYLHDGQWCDATDAGDRKTRVVKLFSDEYFALLRSHPDFSRAQKLGWAMSVNVGDERIVVEKDGKRQSEELRGRTQAETTDRRNVQPFQKPVQQRGRIKNFKLPQQNPQQLQQLQNPTRVDNVPAPEANNARRREEQR